MFETTANDKQKSLPNVPYRNWRQEKATETQISLLAAPSICCTTSGTFPELPLPQSLSYRILCIITSPPPKLLHSRKRDLQEIQSCQNPISQLAPGLGSLSKSLVLQFFWLCQPCGVRKKTKKNLPTRIRGLQVEEIFEKNLGWWAAKKSQEERDTSICVLAENRKGWKAMCF